MAEETPEVPEPDLEKDPSLSRFSEPIVTVSEDDPLAEAWYQYTYEGNPQLLIDLGVLPAEE